MKKCKLIRLISILLVFGFATINLYAGSEETLEIKAYKNYHASEGFLAVYITDAITSSLKLVAESEGAAVADIEPINITPYVENSFLGTVPSSYKEDIVSEENIVFSYRVVGNLSSSYTISFTINPFVQDAAGESHLIAAYYQILNENAVFQGTSSTDSSDSPSWRINLTPSNSHGIASSNNSAELSANWNVQYQYQNWRGNYYYYDTDSSHSPSSDSWIVRGAVAVIVDREDYQAAPNGDYEAICKVRVTSND